MIAALLSPRPDSHHGLRRHPRDSPGGRRRRATVPPDEGAGEAGGLLRRTLPNHRLHAEQLHQFRAAAHLHRDAVQVALPEPAHPDGMERGVGGARGVHRNPAAAEAGRRTLVSRHRRRGVPEPLLHLTRGAGTRHRALGRSRLQDGLFEDAAVSSREERRCDARRSRGADRGGAPIRDRQHRRAGPGHRFPGKA